MFSSVTTENNKVLSFTGSVNDSIRPYSSSSSFSAASQVTSKLIAAAAIGTAAIFVTGLTICSVTFLLGVSSRSLGVAFCCGVKRKGQRSY
jgi:hypothetical protein